MAMTAFHAKNFVIGSFISNDLKPIQELNETTGWTDPEKVNCILEKKYLPTSTNNIQILTAKVDDVVRGYIVVVSSNGITDYIPYMAVQNHYKNHGVGRALLTAAIEYSKSSISLDCRPDVKGFYDTSLSEAQKKGKIKKFSWEIKGFYMNGDERYFCIILK